MQKFGPYTHLDPQLRVHFYIFGVQVALSNTIIMCNGSEMMSGLIDCEILLWCTTNFQGGGGCCVRAGACERERERLVKSLPQEPFTCKNISNSFLLADHKSWELIYLMFGHEPQCQ